METSAARAELDGVLQPVAEQHPVGEAGERVVQGQVLQLCLPGPQRAEQRLVVDQGDELPDEHQCDQHPGDDQVDSRPARRSSRGRR